MQTSILGRTSLEIKRLGFGAIKLPRVPDAELPARIVERAIDLGVNFIVHRMRQKYQSIEKNFNDCADCGECEGKCPFHLPIRQTLEEAEKRLGVKPK